MPNGGWKNGNQTIRGKDGIKEVYECNRKSVLFRQVSIVKIIVLNYSVVNPQLIVSFTSYPARIHAVPKVLESLYAQTMQPNKILFWLAEGQFPNREADLPQQLVDDAAAGKFELRWCDDLGSHKKYFYAMQEFPDDIIVTVDDDIIYHPHTIQTLYRSYLKFPQAVSTIETTLCLFDDDGELLPYSLWPYPFVKMIGKPTMQLAAIGKGGVLYPPHLLDARVFDKKSMLKLCTSSHIPSGDDLWLKMHEAFCDTPVVLASKDIMHQDIAETKTSALWITKPVSFKTNLINVIRKHYEKDGEDVVLHCLQQTVGEQISNKEEIWDEEMLIHRVRTLLNSYNRYKTINNKDEANGIIQDLKRLFSLTQEIEEWAKRSQLVEVRSVFDYGWGLRARLWGDFRQMPDYLQMQSNWKEFFAIYPNVDNVYLNGYRFFLNDMKGFLDEMEQQGCPVEEISAFREAVNAGWKDVPWLVLFKEKGRRLKRVVDLLKKKV